MLLPNNFAPLPISSPGNRVLFGWTGFHGTPESHVFFSFDQAHNVDEFDHAVDQMELGAFNFVAADATNITYRVHVLVPDRGSPADLPTPNVVLDGTNPRTLWTGNFLDSDHLPHSRGGAQGFIASANNDPYGFTANGSIADDPWYYGVWFDPGTRAGRITSELERLLATGNPITADQFQTLQQDTHSEFADLLLPTLTAAFSSTDPALAGMIHDPELVALRDALAGWDRTMDRSSSAAVVFEGWEHFLARGVLADDLSVAFDPVMAAQPIYMLKLLCFTVNRQFPTADHYMQEGRDTLALRALASTRDWLATRFGGADPSHYRWSDFHRTVFKPWMSNGGPFAVPPATTNGAEGTVNVSEGPFFNAAMTTAPNMFHDSSEGSIYRIVTHFDTTGTPVSVVQFPRGNSADPDSPFFGNTVDDWANGVYHTLLFERADIEGSAGVTHSTINPP